MPASVDLTNQMNPLSGGVGASLRREFDAYSEQAGAPSTTPGRIGLWNFDTTNKTFYLSKAVASSADWQPVTTSGLTVAQLQSLADVPASFSFTPSAGAANVCNVLVTPLDFAGNALTGVREFEIFLSDAATGIGLTATSASGTVTNKTSEGTVLTALTAKKHILAQTKAGGTFTLEITDASKTLFYVACRIPLSGKMSVSDQLITANYG